MREAKCECGATITEEDAWYNNSTNEEGEEYGEAEAECPSCHKSYKDFEWGQFKSEEEAMDCIFSYING